MNTPPVVVVIPTLSSLGVTRVASLLHWIAVDRERKFASFIIDNGGHYDKRWFRDHKDPVGAAAEHEKLRIDVYTPGRNIGVAASWNEAMRRYPDSWLVIANDDAFFNYTTVEALVQAAEQDSDAVLVGCELGFGFPLFLLKVKEAVERVGYFDEQFWPAYGEDNDYSWRMHLADLKKIQVTVGVREPDPGTTSREMNFDREALRERATIRYVAKWGGIPGYEKLRTPRVAGLVPEVFMAAVPWRAENLEEILRVLAKDPPRCVHLYLDSWRGHPDPKLPPGLTVVVDRNDGPPRGPGPRWLGASVAPDDVLAVVIDDDMKLDQHYLVRTMAAWTRLQEPFSWGGGGLSWGMPGHYTRDQDHDARLFCMGAGTAAVPAKLLRGIEQDPDAAVMLGYRGHDEAFISWWLRDHRLWRPAGLAIAEDTKLSTDGRAQWAFKSRLLPFEKRLEDRGWVPPEGAPTRSVSMTAPTGQFAWKRKPWQ